MMLLLLLEPTGFHAKGSRLKAITTQNSTRWPHAATSGIIVIRHVRHADNWGAERTIPPLASLAASRQLKSAGYNVTLKIFQKICHTISPEQAKDAAKFLKERLSERAIWKAVE